ncbi:Gfo/Idh/MocA family oxidoreductase [Flammeovirgaceae bacterium SG7u.111]|nr:Gfo/Idh/MocA family oxidoreductase [Flammeovirgaceae bacterium SG7u.132]WPO38757.1 Gfo/Idh/MocA family oxidoreductase [Flammeovirgaceae bacterium SG7u.111]
MDNSRRKFLERSSLLAGAGLATTVPLEAFATNRKKVSANEKLNFAVIGCKGMGWSNMRAHFAMDEIECVALCDVDQNVLEERAADVEKARGKKPKLYGDYRKLLEDKDIDAVIIGTPDHWHCLPMIEAVQAGKHVYVEKPLSNSIGECNLMLKAAKESKQMVQVGQWQRSGLQYQKAHEIVNSGVLGNIRLVKVWAYQGWMKSVPVKPDSAPPKGVDYDMWLGPSKKRPFNPNRFHFTFRWFWDYAGGLMTDWGVHEIDIALYIMGAVAPKSVMASGGKLAYPDDASETPDTLQAVFEYDNFSMLWEHAVGIDGGNYGYTEGIAFIGNKGTLVVNRGGLELIPEKETNDKGIQVYKTDAIPRQNFRGPSALERHAANFVESIKANDRSKLKCWIESGSVAAINAHMGNIAYKTGRKVYWDKAAGMFKDDKEANAMISPEYHNGWKLPKL